MRREGSATRASLTDDLKSIGIARGDAVFVHAALRSVGPIVGGASTMLDALRDVVGPKGTILAYTDWITERADLNEASAPFDAATTPATPDNGWFPEMLRTTPGALRSASPGASCAAIDAKASWFTADHAFDYGYGPHSPFAKLVEANGRVLMLGAPLDTMTLLHHAEHLADIPHKRVIRYDAPILVNGETMWRRFEEFDTSNAPDGFAEDYFKTIVTEFLASGKGKRGTIGAARSVLVDAKEILPFAIEWIEAKARSVS